MPRRYSTLLPFSLVWSQNEKKKSKQPKKDIANKISNTSRPKYMQMRGVKTDCTILRYECLLGRRGYMSQAPLLIPVNAKEAVRRDYFIKQFYSLRISTWSENINLTGNRGTYCFAEHKSKSLVARLRFKYREHLADNIPKVGTMAMITKLCWQLQV